MKKFPFMHIFLRLSSVIALVGIICFVGLFISYFFSKPEKSKIFLDDFSRISFPNNLECDSVAQNSDAFMETFPISLLYQTNEMDVGIDTETEYFSANLNITNPVKIFIRNTNSDINNNSQESVYKELPIQPKVKISVHGKRLWWDSPSYLADNDDLKKIFPNELLPPLPDCSGLEPESDYCDALWEKHKNIAWVNNDLGISYEVGVCGENLAYVPKYKSATVDDLNSLGVSVIPYSKGLIGFQLSFTGVSLFQVNGRNRLSGDDLELLIFFYNPSTEAGAYTSKVKDFSINMVATGISDPLIRGGDASTRAMPGLTYIYNQGTPDEATHYETNRYPINVRLKDNQLKIESPKGSIIADAPKLNIPDGARDLTFSPSIFKPLEFQLNDENQSYISGVGYGYELEIERAGAIVEGKEFIPSPWEQLPREIQMAYITVFYPALFAGVGYTINKRKTIAEFFIWLTSKPTVYAPVTFSPDTYVFRLYSGRKIAGVIDSIEGRTTFRVYVLRDAYEWEKDHWGTIVPSEVRIPQNQIEMYYRAQP